MGSTPGGKYSSFWTRPKSSTNLEDSLKCGTNRGEKLNCFWLSPEHVLPPVDRKVLGPAFLLVFFYISGAFCDSRGDYLSRRRLGGFPVCGLCTCGHSVLLQSLVKGCRPEVHTPALGVGRLEV